MEQKEFFYKKKNINDSDLKYDLHEMELKEK
jgi:hypothetical protein